MQQKYIPVYMNIVQKKKKKKNSTDELYSVHCVHIYLYILPILANFKAKQVL